MTVLQSTSVGGYTGIDASISTGEVNYIKPLELEKNKDLSIPQFNSETFQAINNNFSQQDTKIQTLSSILKGTIGQPSNIKQFEHILGRNDTFSYEYVTFNTKNVIVNLINEFSEWEKLGFKEGLAHISNIKTILEENAKYFQAKDENRILLGILELIFKNNNWSKISSGKIKVIRQELVRFNNGEIEWKKLNILASQLKRLNFSLLYESKDKVST